MTAYEDAIGRYVEVHVAGTGYRVFFEEAGTGIPLLLQHTAGADGRQWRHLLADRELQRRYRMIAYDLPYHGRSLPPEGVEWWREEYRLTRSFLLEFVPAFAAALDLERPVFMGASVGGHLALDLSLAHPGYFCAVLALEGGVYTPEALRDEFSDPRISNAQKAAMMYAITSPTSPEARRREVAWIYSQGAPPVFKGDLHYYSVEHDLRGLEAPADTGGTPVHVLSGEYDWSAPPEQGEAAAKLIGGATFTLMPGLGHFPMAENPELFRVYVKPILDGIANGS